MTRRTRWVRAALVAVLVGVPAAAASVFLAFEVSSQPAFCGSCHVMTPYYDSWKTSHHKEVACVECHIPPGIESELRKKYEAMSMVVRYFTGTYSTNPWTEVDDQSCLRSGCHVRRVLLGRELYQGVLFDHQPHLTEMRRHKQLRCTSCHSQIVQGSHIAVTPTTCFLCHFKGTPLNQGTGRCTLCHAVPEKVVNTGGLSFDHGDVKRFGMDCVACHEGVVRGEGEVPRERCYTCHNDAPRLARYGETDFLHQEHVTDHKVECLNCHIEIQHRIPDRDAAVSTGCESCHTSAGGHAAVRDLYRGIGAKGVDPQPAKMFLAGIRCEACHNRPAGDFQGADEVSCMACHGSAYLTVYRTWQAGLRARLDGVRAELQAAAGAGLAEARDNLAFLERARPIHNPGYALAILRKLRADVAAAEQAAGREPRPPAWLEAPYQAKCLECHFGIEYLSENAFGKPFPHRNHVVAARLRCTACHGGMDDHGTVTVTAEDCASCHERIKRPMADLAAEDCLKCHDAEIGEVSEKVKFPHARHVAAGLDCGMCHAGVGDAPHREFARSPRALPKLGHELCATCHSGDVPGPDGTPPEDANCALCHVGF